MKETRDYLQRLLKRHGVWLKRTLGQHFLVDDTVLEDVAASACPDAAVPTHVVEVGAGAGSLTVALLGRGANVTAIELDRRFMELHQELRASWGAKKNSFDMLDFFYGDALDFDFNAAAQKAAQAGERFVIAGNIPYQITSPLIMKILEDAVPFDSMTLMMQREVAQRMAAAPGSRTIGSISIKVQYFCEIESVCDVAHTCFLPPPKVESRVMRFRRRDGVDTDLQSCKRLFNLVDAGYRMRRKVLPNAVGSAGMYHWTKECTDAALRSLEWSTNIRAEELTVADWQTLLAKLDETAKD